MRNNIKKRIIEEADYIINTKDTIRGTAIHFNTSKSTIHKDIRERLIKIDKVKYNIITSIMDNHVEERHIRGGEATKRKYSCIAKWNTNYIYH